MTHENPPVDYVTFFCKGYCGRFCVVTLQDLLNAVHQHGYKNCADFCNSFFCPACDATAEKVIDSLNQITLDDAPQPN